MNNYLEPPASIVELVKDNKSADAYWKKWLGLLYSFLLVEDNHLVGETGEPAFENSWANYATVDSPARFYKDPFDRVFLAGQIDSGASGTDAFTLPDNGWRPEYEVSIAVVATTTGVGGVTGGHAYVIIGTDGTVNCNYTGATLTSIVLDGISFRATPV